MDLKEISLEKISLERYERLEEIWGDDRAKHQGDIYSRITKTISDNDPERLLRKIFELDIPGKLSVRHPDKIWLPFSLQKGTPKNLKAICDFIAQDKFGKNFLNLSFKYRGQGFIEFAKLDGTIHAYKASINREHYKIITCTSQKPRKGYFNQGLLDTKGL